MTAREVIDTVAAMSQEEWVKIQRGIADLIIARFSSNEILEIREALNQSEAEFERGEGMAGTQVRRQLGLP